MTDDELKIDDEEEVEEDGDLAINPELDDSLDDDLIATDEHLDDEDMPEEFAGLDGSSTDY